MFFQIDVLKNSQYSQQSTYEYYEIFKSNFFYRTLVAPFDPYYPLKAHQI